ncbi:replication initiation factor domain-containing protein [Massilia litorea]|uniref:Replication initiation factor domain-containing protein n=1 Tax=Massilia litorea TaxID=2769491 RepID=A0A7L9U7H9_9BURK|nr:replication initiation factor domain-containing protein [Massilia litorea]QOL50232.1 replication initiation factor domain-containing protein [Massilia litorea]
MSMSLWKTLLIDRIHMNISITTDYLYKCACGQLWGMHDIQKDLLPQGRITVSKGKYSTRIGFYPDKKRKIADIEVGQAHKNRYLKLSLYPPKFVGDEFSRFKEILDSLLPDFSYAKFFFESHVSYIEIACDSLTHLAHTFIPFRQKTNHSRIFCDKHGVKGATYLGSRASNLLFCIYNKTKHLIETKKLPAHKLHTRIEARSRKLKLAPAELLLKMPNPFHRLWIADINKASTLSEDPEWLLFLGACATIGSAAALANLKKKDRKVFMDRLFAARATWWTPAFRWTGLAAALEQIAP